MAAFLLTAGWVLDGAAMVWMVLILIRLALGWMSPAGSRVGRLRLAAARVADAPVAAVRRTLPTLYRQVDFAPWLTLLLLVLVKTFVFRAMIYWGMLHRG